MTKANFFNLKGSVKKHRGYSDRKGDREIGKFIKQNYIKKSPIKPWWPTLAPIGLWVYQYMLKKRGQLLNICELEGGDNLIKHS